MAIRDRPTCCESPKEPCFRGECTKQTIDGYLRGAPWYGFGHEYDKETFAHAQQAARRSLEEAIRDARAAGFAEAIEMAAKRCEDGSVDPNDWGAYYAANIRELVATGIKNTR